MNPEAVAATSEPAPRSTLAVVVRSIASDIKLAHSVFALPFAVLGAFLSRPAPEGAGVFGAKLALVVVCMVCARTWAMVVNRLVDRTIDAANPRTQRRVFASGRLNPRAGWAAALLSAALFIAATAGFLLAGGNPWPLALSIPVLAFIAAYSYTKRFTWLCHLYLGLALAASPAAAAIAIDPSSLARSPSILLLCAMVTVWVAGFDVIYALQDTAFDRSAGLHSVPSRLGPGAAIWISRGLHLIAALLLGAAWWCDERFSVVFGASVALAWALLAAEHVVLARRGEAGLHMAFFTLNGLMSCVVGAAGCLDVALPA